MCLPDQAAVKAIIGVRAFVRLSDGDDALLVSDAPKRMEAYALKDAVARLVANGYDAQVTPRALLAIDWAESRWQAFYDRYTPVVAPRFPQNDQSLALYALARLLIVHPSQFSRQPRSMLRALVKAACRIDGLQAAAPLMLAACAQRLRRHEALPSAAAGLIVEQLRKQDTSWEASS